MGLLTCDCLNIKIHVKNADLKQTTNIEGADDSLFFKQRLALAVLNLEGVGQVHTSLVSKTRHGSWEVQRCSNCQMHTHAQHVSKASQLLVNLSLQRDPSAIQALEKSPDFSPLFKIVLRDINANRVGTVGVESEKYESLQAVLATVQQQLNKFLLREEADMEARIKKYEESQRNAFAELQRKARADKNAMIHLILSTEADSASPTTSHSRPDAPTADAQTDEMDNVLQPAIQPKVVTKTTTAPKKAVTGFNTQTVSSSAERPARAVTSSGLSTRSSSALSQALSTTAPATNQRGFKHVSGDPEAALFDDDPMFPSGDDATSQPFYHSDDEQEDTDDSEVDAPGPAQHNLNMFSTSVPISVPAFTTSKRNITFADESTGQPIGDGEDEPEDIAASMKALARSVHGDGKDIFGDLPRRPRQKFNPAADFSNF